ncbi:hypothetical protein QBC44DRAFT_30036 [Cladorrhinum sp. PSN332]|nr:hypothetical protein QBC44DRAFT_30036 [Cladorrhinum sp. PSN332]
MSKAKFSTLLQPFAVFTATISILSLTTSPVKGYSRKDLTLGCWNLDEENKNIFKKRFFFWGRTMGGICIVFGFGMVCFVGRWNWTMARSA